MELKTYSFNQESCELIGLQSHGKNWPVVYLIHNNEELYVGETNSFQNRFSQHLQNDERTRLTKITFVDDDEFNKSAILDIEQSLIRLCAADRKFKLQNRNAGQSGMHDYFQKAEYTKKIPEIWSKMTESNLTNHSYNDLLNLNLFKYSPYTSLTDEQNEVSYEILKNILDALKNNKKETSLVYGSAGTGKTILAINMIFTLLNINAMNVDVSDEDNELDKWQQLIADWKTYVREKRKNCEKDFPRIAFVVPMQSIRATLKEVFDNIDGDVGAGVVVGPTDIANNAGEFDIVFVDESHRLKRRKNIMEYKSFDNCCEKLGLEPSSANQLDWIVRKSKCRVLFYDPSQSVKSADLPQENYMKSLGDDAKKEYILKSQMRCLGGDDYVDYVAKVFNLENAEKPEISNYDLKVFDDVAEMVENVKQMESQIGLCRVVAGYSWKWQTKGKNLQQIRNENLYDIEIGGNRYIWNTTDKNWILSDNAINEIGCVHTTQGYDLNIVGVIFGNEIDYDERNNCFVINVDEFYDTKVKSATPEERVKEYILNAYKVMIMRGIKGCYMYACKPGMQKFLKNHFSEP